MAIGAACATARAAAISPALELTDFGSPYFGRSAVGVGDINGDGTMDTAVAFPYYALSAGEQYGRIYVHYGSASGPGAQPGWWYEGTINFGNIGFSLAGGDVNGDGYADLLVASDAQSTQGLVYAFYGSPTGLPFAPSWTVRPADSAYQEDIAAADVDNDGYDDVLVGSSHCSRGQVREGCVLLYLGGPSGPSTTAAWIGESDQADAGYGTSVAAAGDVNHDGFDDVVIGAPTYDNGQTNEGRVYVYHGSATGLPATPNRTLEIDQAGANFGSIVATAGDVNGDHFADVVVGASSYDGSFANEGAVFLFKGSATGVATTSSWQVTGGQAGAEMGRAASGGDFDGDGRADLVVGAPQWDGALSNVGRALIYRGDGTTFSTTPDFTATGDRQNGGLGAVVAGLGDTNDDGFAEILAGATSNGSAPGPEALVYTMATQAAGSVAPDGAGGAGLAVNKELYPPPSFSYLNFEWPASCSGDEDYALYEGHLGDFTSHVPIWCGTYHETTSWTIMPSFDAYYLVVPLRLGREGSYGTKSGGVERPQSASACFTREIAPCP